MEVKGNAQVLYVQFLKERTVTSSWLSRADGNRVPSTSDAPLVRVEHLTHVITTRAQKTTILDDLSFDIPPDSLFAINGPSGSGKSTVLNLLTGIDRPTSGRVLFAGQLHGADDRSLARKRR